MKNSSRDSLDYECSAFLTVRGRDLIPNEVTRILGVAPIGSSETSKGKGGVGQRLMKFWRFQTPATGELVCRTAGEVIRSLIEAPKIDLERFQGLPMKWGRSITISVFSDDRPCISLEPETLMKLGSAAIGLEFSIYADVK